MPHNPNTAGTAQRTSSRFSRAPNPANEVNLLWESERTRKLPKRRNTSEAKPCRLQSRSMSCHNKLLSGSGKECPQLPTHKCYSTKTHQRATSTQHNTTSCTSSMQSSPEYSSTVVSSTELEGLVSAIPPTKSTVQPSCGCFQECNVAVLNEKRDRSQRSRTGNQL